MKRLLAIFRDSRFSPNSVAMDRAILEAACRCLPCGVDFVDEAQFAGGSGYDLILTMGRLPQTLERLKACEAQGCKVVNRPAAVERCNRHALDGLMGQLGLPTNAPDEGGGYWLKRGEGSSQSAADVVFCPDSKALEEARLRFARRGITDCVVSNHIAGDEVKFYGVGNSFFRFLYPADSPSFKPRARGQNIHVSHFNFDVSAFRESVFALARAVGIDVYGGDAIIDRHGNAFIIDFNDWPSFAPFRNEAAQAIAKSVTL